MDRVYFLMRGWVGMGMTFAGMVGDGDKYLSPCSSLVLTAFRVGYVGLCSN